MKKFIFIILLSSLCFGKWVMIEGKHYINDTKVMYMYNDESGAIYTGEPIYQNNKNGETTINSYGFRRVPFIYTRSDNGKDENYYGWTPQP